MPDEDHLAPRTLRDYRHGRLTPDGMLAVSDHLAVCPVCRGTLGEIDDGPAYEEIAALVDGSLDPAARTALEARLADSSASAEALADLEQFKLEMAPQAGRVYGPDDKRANGPMDRRKIITPPAESWPHHRSWLFAAAATLLLFAGGWWMLTAPGRGLPHPELLTDATGRQADWSALPTDLRHAVERTLREGRITPSTSVTGLHPGPGKLAGSAEEGTTSLRAVAPAGVTLRDRQPTLHWTTLPEATGYVITVTSLEGMDTQSSPELPATQTSWSPTAPLLPGVIYAWQVEAFRGTEMLARAPAPPAPEVRFRILSDAQRMELAQTEARFGHFPLVMAVAFARAGLDQEAAGQLSELQKEHPQSTLVKRLQQTARTVPVSSLPSNTPDTR